jgi:hypothetical protein
MRAGLPAGLGSEVCTPGSGRTRQERVLSRRVTAIRTVACAGVVAAAVLVSCATVSAQPPQASAASYKTACCYRVLAVADGTFKQNYGMNPSNGDIGTEEFNWGWQEKELVEYIEHNGEPDLEPAETPSGHFAPVLYSVSRWLSESNDGQAIFNADGQLQPEPTCDQTFSRRPHLEYNASFMTIEKSSDYASPNVRKAFKGKKYFLQVAGGDTPGLTPCGIETDVAVGLEPPPGPDNSQDQADQPFGPFAYYVKLPPRNDLRHAKGADNEFQTTYKSGNLSFMECGSHYPMPTCPGDQGNGLHMTTESTDLVLAFTWFPLSELQKQIDDLKSIARS